MTMKILLVVAFLMSGAVAVSGRAPGPPNPLIWGEAANWRTSSNNDAIVWGTGTLTAPEPY